MLYYINFCLFFPPLLTIGSEYDIIKGPIADDGVAVQLERLKSNTEKAESIALDLQDRFLDQQILFGSTRSLNYLKKISVWKQD